VHIHDCFGTLPNYMEDLRIAVGSEFILLYTKYNHLERFSKANIEYLKNSGIDIEEKDIPKIPVQANTTFEDIVKEKELINRLSRYFIT